MKPVPAILLTISLLILTILFSFQLGNFRVPLTSFMVLGTSIWAAMDSSMIKLKKYKSGISYGPVGLFIGLIALWAIAFPWYLSVRYKILHGTAVVKFSDITLPPA